jgi:hypothetical protein
LDGGYDFKVKMWFLNPTKYFKEIEMEQNHHPGKCIYHLSKSYLTEDCNVQKECLKLLATSKGNTKPVSSSTMGQLHHIQEETFEDAVSEDLPVVDTLVDCSNDTKEDSLYYFACLTNHYLHLVQNSSSGSVALRHPMKYPIIADSGANFHMFKEKIFFETLLPASGMVLLRDGQTSLPIKGIGTVKCILGDNILTNQGVQYIPDLAESIYSLLLHIKHPGHGLSSSFEN